jgi:uncharacterized protein YoxC
MPGEAQHPVSTMTVHVNGQSRYSHSLLLKLYILFQVHGKVASYREIKEEVNIVNESQTGLRDKIRRRLFQRSYNSHIEKKTRTGERKKMSTALCCCVLLNSYEWIYLRSTMFCYCA